MQVKQTLILCPLAIEIDAILMRLRECSIAVVEERVGPIRSFRLPELNSILSLGGHGKTQFGIQTQFLLHHYSNIGAKIGANIGAVFCAGCAGAIDDQVSLFDVVIAEKTVEHDFRLRFISRPVPEFSGDAILLKRFSEIEATGFRIHFGRIASGDEDIIDSVRAQDIKAQTQALAVAWEGAGGARACKFNSVPFIEIRGVTDLADSATPGEFKQNLKVAMAHVCDSILMVLPVI